VQLLRHAAKVLIVATVVAACGREETAVVQPSGCRNATGYVGEEPAEGDIRVGRAWISGLASTGRRAWRESYRRRGGYAFFKAHLFVPEGATLTLSVPPEARSLIRLEYGARDQVTDKATVSACHGFYAIVDFTGGMRVRRPLCRAPLDWRLDDEWGRLELSFGDACS
jgi:hypothetical protein